jgi:amidase
MRELAQMETHVAKNQFFEFRRDQEPEIVINSGDEVVFLTKDAHNGTVPDGPVGTDVVFPDLDLKVANPVTGPVFLRDAGPQDTLKVTVIDIILAPKGYVVARPKWGTFYNVVSRNTARIVGVKNGIITFNDKLQFPVRPMIGAMGVIPESGVGYSALPGPYGGNIDHNDIRVGSVVYFPIFIEGAGFGLGDVHASMGDGELSSGAIDICAEVRVKLEILRKKYDIARPIIENEREIIVTSNAPKFHDAKQIAVREMINLLRYGLGVSEVEAYLLITLAGDLRIGQVCDSGEGLIDNTLRLSFPKYSEHLKWNTLV